MLNTAYNYLDLVPKGRDEAGHDFPQFWVRRHDEYGKTFRSWLDPRAYEVQLRDEIEIVITLKIGIVSPQLGPPATRENVPADCKACRE